MSAPSREGAKPSINRQTTAPFFLKLFYRVNTFNPLSDYSIPVPPRRGGPVSGPNSIRPTSPAPSAAPLPQHLEIYTWQSCTLRELSQLLTGALPSLLPDPPIGTRLCYRLIYPDARGAAMGGPDARGRYLSRDLGSVVVGPKESLLRADDDEEKPARPRSGPLRFQGAEADKPLHDERFIVGDYIECAILAPLEDGSVAPPLNGASGPIPGPRVGGGGGGGMRAFRENGYSGYPRGPGRGPDRGGPRGGDRGPPNMPYGDWNRGERLPDGARRGGGGGGRRGWAPY
jgi:histone deacetylase complex subunit SAP18